MEPLQVNIALRGAERRLVEWAARSCGTTPTGFARDALLARARAAVSISGPTRRQSSRGTVEAIPRDWARIAVHLRAELGGVLALLRADRRQDAQITLETLDVPFRIDGTMDSLIIAVPKPEWPGVVACSDLSATLLVIRRWAARMQPLEFLASLLEKALADHDAEHGGLVRRVRT